MNTECQWCHRIKETVSDKQRKLPSIQRGALFFLMRTYSTLPFLLMAKRGVVVNKGWDFGEFQYLFHQHFLVLMIRCTKCHWPPCGWLPWSRSAWPRPRRTSPTSQNLALSTAALTSSEPVWWRRISSPSPPVTSSRLHRRARSWDSLCDLWRRSLEMTQRLLEIQRRDWKTKESDI